MDLALRNRKKKTKKKKAISYSRLAILSLQCFSFVHAMAPKVYANAKNSNTVISKCVCGAIQVAVPVSALSQAEVEGTSSSGDDERSNGSSNRVAVDCHCPACRKFHIAAFTSYLAVPADQVSIQIQGKDIAGMDDDSSSSTGEGPSLLKKYKEVCQEVGPVERLFCGRCYSKVATRPITAATRNGNDGGDEATSASNSKINNLDRNNVLLVNMGPIDDRTIPTKFSKHWKRKRTPWQLPSKAVWTDATPLASYDDTSSVRSRIVTGGCACGKYKFEMAYDVTELQHCYCRLCRRFSGGPFMTWIPVSDQNMRWINDEVPPLVRTTQHGMRHICESCGGAMTIVYDDQVDTTWPAAGTLDDDCPELPANCKQMSQTLGRVFHICCDYRQNWYELPDDGLPRCDQAS